MPVSVGGKPRSGRGSPAGRPVVLGECRFGIRQSRHEERLDGHLPLTGVAAVASATVDAHAAVRLELKRSGSPSEWRLGRCARPPTRPAVPSNDSTQAMA